MIHFFAWLLSIVIFTAGLIGVGLGVFYILVCCIAFVVFLYGAMCSVVRRIVS